MVKTVKMVKTAIGVGGEELQGLLHARGRSMTARISAEQHIR